MRKFSLMLLLLFTVAVTNAQKGIKERIKVYSKAIEGNLANDPAEREVTVYMPPSYQAQPDKRYPVLY
ncbi:MAG: hypothetical protein KDD01_07490, partial [Phaeodactylibacter sp.]|nr:hypothetical protein [Phaeodactylibacter sp.]